jgi:aspartyl-tRNA(Asn)/glutamyl-tRNA(Gln) amidotransferase subunit A
MTTPARKCGLGIGRSIYLQHYSRPVRHHEAHLRDCLDNIVRNSDVAEVALLRRRDADALVEAGACPDDTPLDGAVLTVKACFDVAGWVTHAGSSVLADAPVADTDAPLVIALRDAGAILLAQTNMTEFAYGALGLNDTYGTPTTPLCPGEGRVSGGSTSGGAVAVAVGFADISLGSDTSGSVRIPAAFCGIAAFKPSRGRYPDGRMTYLSTSFDVPGIIAGNIAACRRVDATLTGGPSREGQDGATAPHLLVPAGVATDGADAEVVEHFESWLTRLAAAGVRVSRVDMPMLEASSAAARDGGMISAEAYMLHRDRLEVAAERYDPRVGPRIAAGADVRAHAYAAAQLQLRRCRDEYDDALTSLGADAIVSPTVPILPPRIDELQDPDAYLRANVQTFRLTEFANRLDLPSTTMPGGPSSSGDRRPVGLLLTGRRGGDRELLDLAVQMEQILG